LQRRLLSHLLHRPGLLLALPPQQRARLCAHPEPDLLVEVARYVEQNPEAEPVEILGRWSGTPAHALLMALLEAPLALDAHALQGEFTDGVEKLVAALDRAERRRLLAEVRQAPSREKFEAFWSLKQGGEPGAAGAAQRGDEGLADDPGAAARFEG
jgi:hypothetical protein